MRTLLFSTCIEISLKSSVSSGSRLRFVKQYKTRNNVELTNNNSETILYANCIRDIFFTEYIIEFKRSPTEVFGLWAVVVKIWMVDVSDMFEVV